jgi:hypothetical protein
VLRRHPVILARFAAHHVAGCLFAAREGYGAVRRELQGLVEPEAVAAALVAYEREGARLAAAQRQVGLVEEALRGIRLRPRL